MNGLRNKGAMRLGIMLPLLVGLSLACVFIYILLPNRPPREKMLIENFVSHRSTYERLRDMLQADKQVRRVATWGVETADSVVPHVPPDGGFSADRYKEYLALLGQVGGKGAFRGDGEHSNLGVLVWASGWGGDTRHIDICWSDHEPENRVASLDDYYRTPKPRRPAFRHIDGNWYLWADW